MKVLVTGSKGFVGKNLCSVLRRKESITLFEQDLDTPAGESDLALRQADVVIHLAGPGDGRAIYSRKPTPG
ncbi:MAG: NAD-dependent epimerase/dehydratase family protein [Pseudomonadota bacterium]